jgi:hypothetical protein
MRTAAQPRWLPVALLPLLAIALFVVEDQIQAAAWSFGGVSEYKELSFLAMAVGAVLGAFLTSLIFAYPVAGLYGRRSAFAAGLICVPAIFYALYYGIGHDRTVLWPVYLFQIFSLAIFGPVTAALANSSLSQSVPRE